MNSIIKSILISLGMLLCWNAPAQVTADTLKLQINKQNTIYVTTVFNKKDTLVLNFDTGCTDLIITNDVLKNKLRDEIKLYHTDY